MVRERGARGRCECWSVRATWVKSSGVRAREGGSERREKADMAARSAHAEHTRRFERQARALRLERCVPFPARTLA